MIKTQQVINSIVSNKTGNMTNDAVPTYCIYYNKSYSTIGKQNKITTSTYTYVHVIQTKIHST